MSPKKNFFSQNQNSFELCYINNQIKNKKKNSNKHQQENKI